MVIKPSNANLIFFVKIKIRIPHENEIANAKKIANCFGVIFLLVNKV
jgi:hypothetical protein